MSEIDKIMEEAEHAYFREDDIEKVLKLTEKAIEIEPTDIRPWDLMGVALFETGHNDESMICYDKILSLDPENNDAKLKKGQVYTEIGKYDDAIAIFDELIENRTDRKDEAIIAKLTLYLEQENEEAYQETMELCKQIIAEEDSKYLKDEIGFIESVHSIMESNKK
ncbi:MAG: tetratricopeptide repeat protein [Methanobrevibacter sp.]|uniref:tetratricopeptide repeat protein n=1 Tax=Methanobrevibacter sp. TaxID=66852 RepID=UPI0026E0AC36|nr:tetratricopeptide repeat protein [Methanobrevibacter sp.]MDO5849029.1 tetratricopeptide repeat protein [Methanobrevibacter sp.]